MASNGDMEVTIRMTPLGQGEAENLRVIKLNRDKKEVEIGRASKNAHKGLTVASDNAWFDYPILSRTHAKFTASPPLKALYVQDCGSTHGTYLGKQKIETGVEYKVNDGDVITFGQRVTSGAVTYPAKEFRVQSTWDSRMSVALPRQSASVTHNLGSSRASVAKIYEATPAYRFEVPEDFNDSSSERSRESSIQVIESHPRTFSIPSSDGDSDSDGYDSELEIASSVKETDRKDSAATPPDHGSVRKEPILVDLEPEESNATAKQNKPRGLNLQGPSITKVLLKQPASIGVSPGEPIDLEGDSASKQDVADSESEDEGPEIHPIQQSLQKDGTNQTHSDTTPVHFVPTADEETDFEDDDMDQEDDISDFSPEETTVDSFRKLMKSTPGPAATQQSKPHITSKVEEPQAVSDMQVPSIQNYMPAYRTVRPGGFGVSVSDAVDVSQPAYLGFPPFSAQRAPSPSDAALARNPPGSTGFDSYPGLGSIYPKPSAAMDFSSPQNFDQISANNPYGYQPYRRHDYSFHSRPYTQGPFYNREQALPSGFGDTFGGANIYNPSTGQGRTPTIVTPDTVATAAVNNIDDDARFAAELQAEEDALATAFHTSSSAVNPPATSSESRKAIELQSSKINISSLVNEPHAENARPLKRKIEEMASETGGEDDSDVPLVVKAAKNWAASRLEAHSPSESNSQQETPMPDAQARDVLHPADEMSVTQSSSLVPIVSSVPAPITATTTAAEGPARKRTKTSAKSSRGIGKFVSGVCVGLVGALATFIATIPASVHEEALRELSNAV